MLLLVLWAAQRVCQEVTEINAAASDHNVTASAADDVVAVIHNVTASAAATGCFTAAAHHAWWSW